MTFSYRSNSREVERSISRSFSRSIEPSASASFLGDNTDILREMGDTTMKFIPSDKSDQEHSISHRQMNPKYPSFTNKRSSINNKQHNKYHTKSNKTKKTNKYNTSTYYNNRANLNNINKCCGYPERKSDIDDDDEEEEDYKDPPLLTLPPTKDNNNQEKSRESRESSYRSNKSSKSSKSSTFKRTNNKSMIKRRSRIKRNIKTKKHKDTQNSYSDIDDDTYNVTNIVNNEDDIKLQNQSRRSKSISDGDRKSIMEHLEKFRNLNGVLFGQLIKFQGNDLKKIKANKIKSKFVVYVPQKQLLFYAENKNSNDKTTIISVRGIEINDINIEKQLPHKYKDKWFKIIGHTRIVLFASSSTEYTLTWNKVILSSLSINIKLIEPRITLNDQHYIDGWLGKFKGNSGDNIKFKKGATAKYVIFLPTMKILFFCGEQKNKVKTTLVHIRKITRKNKYISGNMPDRYKDSWFKIIGEKRIVVFVAQSNEERDIWFTQILKALYPTRDFNGYNEIK